VLFEQRSQTSISSSVVKIYSGYFLEQIFCKYPQQKNHEVSWFITIIFFLHSIFPFLGAWRPDQIITSEKSVTVSYALQVALRAVVLQPVVLSADSRDWLVVSTILPQVSGPKWGWC
jgi:hypothetical protein